MRFKESDFERILGALDTGAVPNPEHRAKVRREMLAAFEEAERTRPRRDLRRPRKPFRLDRHGWRVLAKWTASLAILLLIGGAAWLIVRGRPAVASYSFELVLQRVREATSVSYDSRFEAEGLSDLSHVAMAEPGLLRSEVDGEKAWVMDFGRGMGLMLSRAERMAYIVRGREMVPRSDLDLLAHIRKLSRQDGRFVGTTTLEGKAANVFKADVPHQKVTLWASPATDLPMRVEIVGEGDGKDNRGQWAITLSNFRWNAALPAGLFSLEPPPGYTVDDPAIDDTTEADLLHALRACASMASGVFPDAFDKPTVARVFLRALTKDSRLIREPSVAGSRVGFLATKEGTPEQKAAYRVIQRGLRFAQKQAEDGNDWQYRGAGVRLGDAARIICSWKSSGLPGCRAVLGDLTVKALAAEELPGPASQPGAPPLGNDSTPK